MGYYSDLNLGEDHLLFDHPFGMAIEQMPIAEKSHETKAACLETQIKRQSDTNFAGFHQGKEITLNDSLKSILEKHFGTPQKTLTIDGKLQRSNSTYYYTFQGKKSDIH